MKKKLVFHFLTLVFSISTIFSFSQDNCLPKKPNRENKLVYNFIKNGNYLSAQQERSLNANLVQFAQSTSTQILVVLVDDLCGYDKAQFTYELGEKWGIGQKGKDNGIVIMVKPTGGQGQRHTFIATGYGLEGVIPDATAKLIVENEMIPQFKKGNIYGGIVAAVNTLESLALEEFSAKEYKSRTTKKPNFGPFFIVVIFILISLFSTYSKTRRYARSNNISWWAALMLMSSSTRSHGGSYGNFSSGSGSFGGFGGGSFGGGGSGGSW